MAAIADCVGSRVTLMCFVQTAAALGTRPAGRPVRVVWRVVAGLTAFTPRVFRVSTRPGHSPAWRTPGTSVVGVLRMSQPPFAHLQHSIIVTISVTRPQSNAY